MARFNLFLKLLIPMLLFTYCSQETKIGLLMDSIEQERWTKDRDFFVQKVEELGGTVTVKVAGSDPDVQFQQALEMINNDVDALVIIPVDMTVSEGIVKMAKKKNIPVISYDRLIRNSEIDFYVSTDNIDVGEQQADFLTKVKPSGNYVLIDGPTSDYNSYQLHIGWKNILQPYIERGDIKLAGERFLDDWSTEEAYNMMDEILNESVKIDAILAGNDALAGAAIRALKDHNIQEDVLIAGQDADIAAIQNIILGDQTITVYKPIESIALSAATIAVKMAKGKDATESMICTVNNGHRMVPAILLKGQVVNKDNIRMTVVSEGFVEEQEIYN